MSAEKKPESHPDDKPKRLPRFSKKWRRGIVIAGLLAGGIALETHYSYLQAHFFSSVARGAVGTKQRRSGPEDIPQASGPYDERLGYTKTALFRKNLEKNYDLQDGLSWNEQRLLGIRISPIYNRKAMAGLRIVDDRNAEMYAPLIGEQYKTFDEIPPKIARSLLFVENRALLEEHPDTWNPAIEWPRFVNAILGYGLKKVGVGGDRSGGSTLATQIEKFQHSPDGITASPGEKLSQMLTASARAYKDGISTVNSSRAIVLEYLNFMPLSSYPGYGEVIGFAEGMRLWFGADVKEVNRLLTKPEKEMDDDEFKRAAQAYRQSLSLVMAVKKPSAYLLKERQELEERIDNFLPLLVEAGVISDRMKTEVASQRVVYQDPAKMARAQAVRQKASDALQIELMQQLGLKSLYDLRRLDLTATTTVDAGVSQAVTKVLGSLKDPEVATKSGLTGYQLLNPEAAGSVVYAFTLYERLPDGTNVLRVQTDNYDGQLNLNEGTKLELGSTSKLRTLVSYLEAFSFLHSKYSDKTPEQLKAIRVPEQDHMTRFALDYFSAPGTDKSLNAFLEATLERKYSGSPGERFFTGGGIHVFENFEAEEDYVSYPVKEAFHKSVNLSFIRIMRDVVAFTQTHKMGVDPDIYTNINSPQRRAYLEKFADREGQTFLWQAWQEQKDKTPEEVAGLLADKGRGNEVQAAVIFRSMFPNAPYEKMAEFMDSKCRKCPDGRDHSEAYEAYAKDKFDLNDRAYLTNVHPLALWLASYKIEKPDATWKEVVAASAQARQETYEWLFNPKKVNGQNARIRTMLEQEAFTHIHASWKALGYPFETMVPSLASALGSSGDTPAALAELAGIIQHDGVRKAPIRFTRINFGEETPYALDERAKSAPEKNVLPKEVTKLVRREMQKVVEEGTGRRVKGAIRLGDGRVLPVGGKTGTGDNRMHTFSRKGNKTSSEAKSRTATFVYAIDDRFYGCVTAFVDGPEAGKFKFTSGLAVQVLKNLGPVIRPVLDKAYGVDPSKIVAPPANENKKPPKPKPPTA